MRSSSSPSTDPGEGKGTKLQSVESGPRSPADSAWEWRCMGRNSMSVGSNSGSRTGDALGRTWSYPPGRSMWRVGLWVAQDQLLLLTMWE